VYPKTTVREFCRMLSADMDRCFLYAEGADGKRVGFHHLNLTKQQLGEDDEITKDNNIIKYTTAAVESSNITFKEPKQQDQKSKPIKKSKEEEPNDK
jgi:hypothetical protein